MGAIEEVATAILNWITATRLRTALIATVLFGLVAVIADRNGWVSQDVPHVWFVIAYAVAVLALLLLLVAAAEVGVSKGSRARVLRLATRAVRAERLANFAALDDAHKRCFVYLKQQNRRRFIDQDYAMLNDLVRLQLLERRGGVHPARSYEVAQEIWEVMQEDGWGNEYPRLDREPWHLEAWMGRRI
jgi:hypothetical protein